MNYRTIDPSVLVGCVSQADKLVRIHSHLCGLGYDVRGLNGRTVEGFGRTRGNFLRAHQMRSQQVDAYKDGRLVRFSFS